jgi:pimeloyl-ACP methyl ester carboxylesterase
VLEQADRAPAGDVVLCHGTPWSARVWAPVARALSREYRVFLWDMPGYGASPKGPEVAVDLVTQRRRLAALLRHWSLDRPHVVAHDIGGAVALGAHLLEDVDVASLFLLDIVMLDPWGSPFFRLVAENEAVFAAVPGPLHGALVREYIAGAANHGLPDDVVGMLAEPWLDQVGQRRSTARSRSSRPSTPRRSCAGSARCAARSASAGPTPTRGSRSSRLPGSARRCPGTRRWSRSPGSVTSCPWRTTPRSGTPCGPGWGRSTAGGHEGAAGSGRPGS